MKNGALMRNTALMILALAISVSPILADSDVPFAPAPGQQSLESEVTAPGETCDNAESLPFELNLTGTGGSKCAEVTPEGSVGSEGSMALGSEAEPEQKGTVDCSLWPGSCACIQNCDNEWHECKDGCGTNWLCRLQCAYDNECCNDTCLGFNCQYHGSF